MKNLLDMKVSEVEDYINKSISYGIKDLDVAKELKDTAMCRVYSMFKDLEFEKELNYGRTEHIRINTYRGLRKLSKFEVEIKVEDGYERYLKFDISNPKIKKTKIKIGDVFGYEFTDKTFEFRKIRTNYYKYIFGRRENYPEFELNPDLTFRENMFTIL